MRSFIIILSLFITLATCQTVSVQNYYVNPALNNTAPCGNSTEFACQDIASALLTYSYSETNATSAVLYLGSSNYTGANNTNFNTFGRNITLMGTSSSSQATIYLTSGNRLINMSDAQAQDIVSSSLDLVNLYVMGGDSPFGGVVLIDLQFGMDTVVRMTNVTATANSAQYGAVLAITNSIGINQTRVHFDGCSFSNNNAINTGAVFYTKRTSIVTLANSQVNQNTATSGDIFYATRCELYIVNTIFQGNKAANSIVNVNSNIKYPVLEQVTFDANTLGGNGAAALLVEFTDIVIYESQFSSTQEGNAILFNGVNLYVIDTVFDSNKGVDSGALNIAPATYTNINGSTFINNYANTGAAIYLNNTFFIEIENTVFLGGQLGSGQGSAIYIANGLVQPMQLSNVTFSDNSNGINQNPIYCTGASIVLDGITSDQTNLIECDFNCDLSGSSAAAFCLAPTTKPTKGPNYGLVVGIVVGGIAGAALFALIIYIFYKRHQNAKKMNPYH